MATIEPQSSDQKSPKSIGTVLVIGGCGFLGANMVDQLLNFPSDMAPGAAFNLGPNSSQYQYSFPSLTSRYPKYDSKGTKVHALDLRCPESKKYKGCTYHEADITDAQALLAVFKKVKPDVVINTASPAWNAPHDILRKVNIDGTRILLEVAGGVTHGSWGGKCKAFVHTSSSSVVHDALTDLKHADERYPYVVPNPREYYSETKVHAERLVLEANGKEEFGGILTAAVRPAGIVGPGDLAGFTGAMLAQAKNQPDWQLHIQLGEGGNLFDTTYVGNVVYGHLLVADALLETASRAESNQSAILDHEKVDGEAFNVTNDEPTYFWNIARFIFSRYGRDIKPEKIWSLGENWATIIGALSEFSGLISGRKPRLTRQSVKYSCMSRYYSCEKLKRRCGYKPIVSIEEGLARAIQWHKESDFGDAGVSNAEKKSQ